MPFLCGLIAGMIVAGGAAAIWGKQWKQRALAAEAEIKAAAAHAKAAVEKLEMEVEAAADGALKFLADRLTYFGERL